MKPLESPQARGDLTPFRWYSFSIATRWKEYTNSLKKQLNDRGPVTPEVWDSLERLEIAYAIEAILGDCCWGERLHFHPDDPWRIIGEQETDTLNENVFSAINERFGVDWSEDFIHPLLGRAATFGDVVDFIREKQHSRK